MFKLFRSLTWPIRSFPRTLTWSISVVLLTNIVSPSLSSPWDHVIPLVAAVVFWFIGLAPFFVLRRGPGWEVDSLKPRRGWRWIQIIANLAPIYGDIEGLRMGRRVRHGIQSLVDMGIVSAKDNFVGALQYEDPRAGTTILIWIAPGRVQLDQLTKTAWESRGRFQAESAEVTQAARSNKVRFEFGPPRANPLDAPTDVSVPELMGHPFSALPYGMTGDGSILTLSINNQSGCVVGGVPGSGKSEGAKVIATTLMDSSETQFVVFDGKGGSDWEWIASRASLWHTDDENLEQVADLMEQLVQVMRHRARALKGEIGNSNLWHSGPTSRFPLIFTIVDECQTYFESSAYRGNKRAQEAIARITAAVTALVKKGRSVGMFTMLITQKPTAESLPTALRDNCGPRWCGRVMTREAAEAVLGSFPDGSSAVTLPTSIPSQRPGGVIIRDERTGALVAGRFFYLPEHEAERLAKISSVHRVPFDVLTAVPETDTYAGAER